MHYFSDDFLDDMLDEVEAWESAECRVLVHPDLVADRIFDEPADVGALRKVLCGFGARAFGISLAHSSLVALSIASNAVTPSGPRLPATVTQRRSDGTWDLLFRGEIDATTEVVEGVVLRSGLLVAARRRPIASEPRFKRGRAVGEIDFAPLPSWLVQR